MSGSVSDFCTASRSAEVEEGDGDGIVTAGKAAAGFLTGASPEYQTGHCFLGGILGWKTLAGLARGMFSGRAKLRVATDTPLEGEAVSFFL